MTNLDMDLGQFTQDMLLIAKGNLERDGSLMPMAFVLTGEGDVHVLGITGFDNNHEKRQVYAKVSKYAAQTRAQAVLLINDFYYVMVDSLVSKEQAKHIQPSNHPKRKEAIVAALIKPNGTVASMSACPYSRVDGKIAWEKVEELPPPEGAVQEGSEQQMLPPWGPKVPSGSREVVS